MERCNRCNEVVKKGKGYPIKDKKVYCRDCFEFLQEKDKLRRGIAKRCKKK